MIQKDVSPDRDASLGLIFRLNNLWSRVDYASVDGKYDLWDYLLDAIYRNLLFRENISSDIDKKTGIVTRAEFSEKDKALYRYFSLQIAKARKTCLRSKNSGSRGRWYHRLQDKDTWLRKFMQSLKLYLKETERRPGSTTFGTFGRKR